MVILGVYFINYGRALIGGHSPLHPHLRTLEDLFLFLSLLSFRLCFLLLIVVALREDHGLVFWVVEANF